MKDRQKIEIEASAVWQAAPCINPPFINIWNSYLKVGQLLASGHFKEQAPEVLTLGQGMLKSLALRLKEQDKKNIDRMHHGIILGTLKLALQCQHSTTSEAYDFWSIALTGDLALQTRDFNFDPKQIEAIPQLGPLLDKIPQIKQQRFYLDGLHKARLAQKSYLSDVAQAWFFGALTLIPGAPLIRALRKESVRGQLKTHPWLAMPHLFAAILTPVTAYYYLKADLEQAKVDQLFRDEVKGAACGSMVKITMTLEAFKQERQTKRQNKAALAALLAQSNLAFAKVEGKPRKQVSHFVDDDRVEKVAVYMDKYQLERHRLFQKPVTDSEEAANDLRLLHATLQAKSVDLDRRIQSGPR
jgi:hypothetical protein